MEPTTPTMPAEPAEPADPLGTAPNVGQVLAMDAGLHLFLRRLPTRQQRHDLLALARSEATPDARRLAFVVGCLCMPDGTPQTLPPSEIEKLNRLSLDEWDETITKAARLNSFAVLQVTAD